LKEVVLNIFQRWAFVIKLITKDLRIKNYGYGGARLKIREQTIHGSDGKKR
jgi:hypothetical protein